MSDTRFSLVTWTPYGADGFLDPLKPTASVKPLPDKRIAVKLTQPFEWKAGVEAGTYSAVASYLEFEKLDSTVLGRHGVMEFWFKAEPPAPPDTSKAGDDGQTAVTDAKADVTIQNIKILDFAPSPGGVGLSKFDIDAGDLAAHTYEYQITFTDFRHAFKEPRGGRLRGGEINTYPPKLVLKDGKLAKETETSNIDLLTAALNATHKAYMLDNSFATTLTKVENVRNLKWFASHAPTELAKLLKAMHLVAVPLTSGWLKVFGYGGGDTDLRIPEAQKLFEADLSGSDRRGKTVIFTSAPTPVVVTHENTTLPEMRYVIWADTGDGNGDTWHKIEDVLGSDPKVPFRNDFVDYADFTAAYYRSQAFRAIQLDPEKRPPAFSAILNRAITDGKQRQGVKVAAKIAVLTGTKWANSTTFVNIPVQWMDQENGVLVLSDELGQVAGSVDDYKANFLPLDLKKTDQLQMKITLEAFVPAEPKSADEAAKPARKKYFTCGFEKQTGADLKAMTEDEAVAAMDLSDPDVVVIQVPQFQQIIVGSNGTPPPDNRSALVAKCRELANLYLAGSDAEVLQIEVSGFFAVELSGRVASVAWDQEAVKTTIKVMTWWQPAEALSDDQIKLLGQEQFPGQVMASSQAVDLGFSQARQPTSVPTPPFPPDSGSDGSKGKKMGEFNMMLTDSVKGWSLPFLVPG